MEGLWTIMPASACRQRSHAPWTGLAGASVQQHARSRHCTPVEPLACSVHAAACARRLTRLDRRAACVDRARPVLLFGPCRETAAKMMKMATYLSGGIEMG